MHDATLIRVLCPFILSNNFVDFITVKLGPE